MGDMMRGALGNWEVKYPEGKHLFLQAYDGDVISADTLLYNSQRAEAKALTSSASVVQQTPLDFRRPPLDFALHPARRTGTFGGLRGVWRVVFGGTIISLLLFGLMLWRRQRLTFYKERVAARRR